MSNITKLKISRILVTGLFWMPIVVYYFETRGLEISEIFQLLSFYSLAIVLLEYPTGVIGDYFSHKTSTVLGYFMTAIALLLFMLPGGMFFYGFGLFVAALGMSLSSGSDNALLYSVTSDYKKDFSNLKTLAILWSVIGVSIGGFVAKFYITLPFLLTAISFVISAALTAMVCTKTLEQKSSANIFAQATEGVKFMKTEKIVRNIIIVYALFGAFFMSLKWIYNPLFETLYIDIFWWGVIISAFQILTALGTALSSKVSSTYTFLLLGFGVIATALIGITNVFMISMLGLLALHTLRGMIETDLEIQVTEKLNDSIRASILSLKNLLIRLSSAAYIAMAGYVISGNNFFGLFAVTAGVLAFIAVLLFPKGTLNLNTQSE